jgi:hypothetical protein
MYPLNNTLEKIEYIHRKTIQHGKMEYIEPKRNQKKREKAKDWKTRRSAQMHRMVSSRQDESEQKQKTKRR